MVERISYQDKEVDSLVRKMADLELDASYYLLLLAGKNRSAKKQVLNKLKKESVEFHSVDLRDVITTVEEDAYKNIDDLFRNLPESPRHLYLENADVLSGEYTGFTYSSVRYATPQEKYLLQKIKGSERIVILEMVDKENITKALERTAQTAIDCDLPTGFFSKLKQMKVHGHTFENKRPADVR